MERSERFSINLWARISAVNPGVMLHFGILVKKSAANQKRWQISKNDLCRFDSQFSIESKNEIKLGRFHLTKHNFSVFVILGHLVYIPQYFPNMQ
jgi:hypothetical protein